MNRLQIDNAQELRLFLQEEIYVLPDDLTGSNIDAKTRSDMVLNAEISEVKVTTSNAQVSPIIAKSEVKFLGGNGQRILILLKDTLDKELHAEERKLLMAILDAIKIKVPDYALVFWDAHQDYSFTDFTQNLNSQKVLSFGMKSTDLGLQNLAFNQIHQYEGVSFILTQHLTDLKNDLQAKRSFWTTLKVLFP